MKKLILFGFGFGLCLLSFSQTVVVSDDPTYTTGASSAMLDVKSTNKGFLLPRVADTTAISSPTAGLMIYDTTNKKVWMYFNNRWNTQINAGSTSSGVTVSSNGTVTLNGESTTWNDLVVNPATARNNGGLVPNWTVFVAPNVYTWFFADGSNNEVDFSVQMPHNYKEGSKIYPHVHWSSTSAPGLQRVKWVMDYQWVNFGDNFLPTGTSSVYGSALAENNSVSLTAFQHTITPMNPLGVAQTGIDGTGKKVSSILLCHFYRQGADATDTFSGSAALLSVDFHYEIDSFGSDGQYTK
ncbi:MAG: hypothetical protein ACOYOT_02060 [Bacteroidales bacterium]